MRLPLCYYGNPVLRKKCARIDAIDDELRQLVVDMQETMFANDGAGLAAPQIGKSIALFIVHVADNEEIDGEGGEEEGEDDQESSTHYKRETEVFINPKILEHSQDIRLRGEGCLSIPRLYAEVERPYTITVEATDLTGNRFTKTFSGLKARAIMHENDHLNGVLFIDRIHGKARQELEAPLRIIKKKYS